MLSESIFTPKHTLQCFDLNHTFSLLSIKGRDAKNFLNTLTTAKVKELKSTLFGGDGIENALLDKRGHLLFQFKLFACKSENEQDAPHEYKILINKKYAKPLKEALHFYLFDEEVSFSLPENAGSVSFCLAIEGKGAACCVEKIFATSRPGELRKFLRASTHTSKLKILQDVKQKAWVTASCFTHSCGFLIFAEEQEAFEKLQKKILDFIDLQTKTKNIIATANDWHSLRQAYALPLFGHELEAGIPALHAGNPEAFIHKDKGCYIGQEIIARSLSRMKEASEKLMALFFVPDVEGLALKLLQKILSGDSHSGIESESSSPLLRIKSAIFSDSLQEIVVLGYLRKDFASDGDSLPLVLYSQNDKKGHPPEEIKVFLQARVKSLPVKISPTLELETLEVGRLYKEAIRLYHGKDIALAKEKFEGILKKYPLHHESLEALALIAEHSGDMEEALGLNKQLSLLQPLAIMPHTNLSRLYMLQGEIEKAEAEKQRATLLTFKQTAKESSKVREEQAFLEKQRAERARKKKLFTEVIEQDAEDDIALFALGKICFEEKNFSEAAKLLEKLIQIKPSYSLAYFFYAKSLLALGESSNKAKVQSILIKGIEYAKKNGEMMPLRSMQRELNKQLIL